MRSAISSTRVSMVVSPCLERKGVAEDAGARKAACEGTNEVERIHLDAFAVDALAELAAGRTLQHQLEGLAVDIGPFEHDVGDEAAVVLEWADIHGQPFE